MTIADTVEWLRNAKPHMDHWLWVNTVETFADAYELLGVPRRRFEMACGLEDDIFTLGVPGDQQTYPNGQFQ